MSNEFDKVISLTSSLKDIFENEISIKKIKQNIKDFVLEIENITKIYSQNEQKLVEYIKAEKDFDYMLTYNLMIEENIVSTSKDLIPIDYEYRFHRHESQKKF